MILYFSFALILVLRPPSILFLFNAYCVSMDGVAAFGLAANIISFLDLGNKIFSTARQVHQGNHADDRIDLDVIIKILKKLSTALTTLSESDSMAWCSIRASKKSSWVILQNDLETFILRFRNSYTSLQ